MMMVWYGDYYKIGYLQWVLIFFHVFRNGVVENSYATYGNKSFATNLTRVQN
jgi:hypothetical protein